MRTRTLQEGLVEGLHTWDTPGDERTSSAYSVKVVTTDVVDNPGGENPLTIVRTVPCGGVINGPAAGGYFDNWPLKGDVPGTHHNLEPNLSGYVSRTLAGTSPERPVLSVPVAIAEMRDLPRLYQTVAGVLKRLSRNISRRKVTRSLADLNLAYEFGLKPFLADVRNLFDVPAQVQSRVDLFREIASSGGVSRTIHLYDVRDEFDLGWWYLHSTLGLWIRATRTDTVTGQVWGNAKWLPKAELLDIVSQNKDRILAKAARQSLVASRWRDQPSNLYEGLPWTWLADWFFRFGDYLQLSGNSLTHSANECCIMSHFTTTRTYSDISKPESITISDPGTKYETKRRVVYPTSEYFAAVPILSKRQLGILSSLCEKFRP